MISAIYRRKKKDVETRLTSWAEIERIRTGYRQGGKKVVFTNGCFDVLHAGHIRYLEAARSLGDVLLVGLNSNASVQRLKGAGRPLVDEEDRAVLLTALRCVDYVIRFDEDTPLKLITMLLPDVLVKGGDYQPAHIVGRDTVIAQGGEVVTIPFVAGKSTSGLIEKVKSLLHQGML